MFRPHAVACMFSSPTSRRVLWEITNRCNASCVHCCNSSGRSSADELRVRRFDELFAEAAECGIDQMYLTGGEPLLHPDFLDILLAARQRFPKTIFSSNGFYIDESVARRIAAIHPDYAMLSVDSTDPDCHDAWRGRPGLHRRVFRAIEALTVHGVPVRVNVTVTRRNLREVEAIAQWCAALNVRTLLFSVFMPIGRGRDHAEDLRISDEDARGLEVRINCLRDQYASSLSVAHKRAFTRGLPLEKCPGGDSYFYVAADGRMTPCPWIGRDEQDAFRSVSLVEHGFREAVHSLEMVRFREFIERRQKTHDCRGCAIEGCGHGCPALAKSITGDEMGFDPYCREYIS